MPISKGRRLSRCPQEDSECGGVSGRTVGVRASQSARRRATAFDCAVLRHGRLERIRCPARSEDFRRLVETFLQNCSTVARRHQGLVASYIGDAVKAYFGYPVAEEDDAERAVLAGLDMLEAVAAIAAASAQPLQARLGVASGQVVIGASPAHPPAYRRSPLATLLIWPRDSRPSRSRTLS
jgi:class 3 adenylate cyclase